MLTIYSLKSRFQDLLRPIVEGLAQAGITANFITLSAIILSLVYGSILTIFSDEAMLWILLPLILFIRMALNAIDGMLAREFNQKSKLGAILNEMGDVVSDTALFLPFALLHQSSLWPVIAFCLLSVISEMIGVVAVQIGATRRYDGPMGKSDRAFVTGALAFGIGCGFLSPLWISWVVILASLLIVLTIFNRARSALKENPHG